MPTARNALSSQPDTQHNPPTDVVIGTCPGCGSLSINPLDSEGCCEGTPGLILVLYRATAENPHGEDTPCPW